MNDDLPKGGTVPPRPATATSAKEESLTPRKPAAKRRLWIAAAVAILLGTAMGVFVTTQTGLNLSRKFSVEGLVSTVASSVGPSPDEVFGGRDRINILLVGRDVDRDRRDQIRDTMARSDTILIAGLDRYTRSVSLLSVPRDTLAHIPGHGSTKINAAHSYGGPQLLADTIRENFGLSLDHYMKIRFDGFERVIDMLGGVWVDVEKDMDYDDNWGNLHIHLRKGYQKLDGAKAHQYVRFRHDRFGDLGRVQRQQKLMRAIVGQALTPAMLTKLPRIMETMLRYVETDMTTRDLLSLAAFGRSVEQESIFATTLPIRLGGNYCIAVRSQAEPLLLQMFGDTFHPDEWAAREVAPVVASGRRAGRAATSKAPAAEGPELPPAQEIPPDLTSMPGSETPLPEPALQPQPSSSTATTTVTPPAKPNESTAVPPPPKPPAPQQGQPPTGETKPPTSPPKPDTSPDAKATPDTTPQPEPAPANP